MAAGDRGENICQCERDSSELAGELAGEPKYSDQGYREANANIIYGIGIVEIVILTITAGLCLYYPNTDFE